MSDVVDKVISISGGISATLAFILYKCYKSKGEFAEQIKNIPVFRPDDQLYNSFNEQENDVWSYAAVEGVVKDLGRTITSHHGPTEGVVMKTKLVEHKSKRVNGFWSESKKDLRDNLQTVPFAIVDTSDNGTAYKVEVIDPQVASHLQSEMDLTFDRFEPHKPSIMEIGMDRLFGEVTKGIQETETMLINGTSVLALGRVFLDRQKAKIGPPFEDKYSYIITKMSLGELVRSYESQSKTLKVLSIVSALIGSSLLVWLLWRKLKKWLHQREQRREFENIRSAIRSQRSSDTVDRNSEVGACGDDDDADTREENGCVICLSSERQVIALPCGHISTCLNCAEAIPSPKTCPICRASVERFMQAFYS